MAAQVKPTSWSPRISIPAFEYLVVQHGRIADLAFDSAAWEQAYCASLVETFQAIDQFLPATCSSILDIGGGLGGIDALLNAHYGGDVAVTILDGIADPPIVVEHNKTYSDAGVAKDFLHDNGVAKASTLVYAPGDKISPGLNIRFDLVLGIQSWGFHFPPADYKELAMSCSRPGTIWILDVREDKRLWAVDLFTTEHLEPIGEALGHTTKYTRLAFRVTE